MTTMLTPPRGSADAVAVDALRVTVVGADDAGTSPAASLSAGAACAVAWPLRASGGFVAEIVVYAVPPLAEEVGLGLSLIHI